MISAFQRKKESIQPNKIKKVEVKRDRDIRKMISQKEEKSHKKLMAAFSKELEHKIANRTVNGASQRS